MAEFESSVEIPEGYFLQMAEKDYSYVSASLVREFFQNSVDAGADNFIICADPETSEIMFIDDGCGMNENTILNKLLVLGASSKDGIETAGAFGHAKILIYFSWESYTIRTRDIEVSGRANFYSLRKSDQEYVNGTVSTIRLPKEYFDSVVVAIPYYFGKCDTQCAVRYIHLGCSTECTVIQQNLKCVGVPIDIVDFDVYATEPTSCSERYVYVRTKGVYMFSTYVASLKVALVAETKKHPYVLFNQNRDSLKHDADEVFRRFTGQLAVDSLSTIKLLGDVAGASDPRSSKPTSYYSSYECVNDFTFFGISPDECRQLITKCGERKLSVIRRFVGELGLEWFENVVFCSEGRCLGFASELSDGKIVIGIAPTYPLRFWKDRRKFVFVLLDIIAHEAAHVVCNKNDPANYYGYHNETFATTMMELRRGMWDLSQYYKIWKEMWNDSK